MIVALNRDSESKEFEKLLDDSRSYLEKKLSATPTYLNAISPINFEKEVFEVMQKIAQKTIFKDNICLISGHKFPDIIGKGYFGVEVKTSKNNWRSTGNSVLETTRVEGIERIYLFFAKLNLPIDFKIRKYEECLYDVAVTHSPRYLIDMNLNSKDSIFSKMRTSYQEICGQESPIRPFIEYYREKAKKNGEEPWWMESESPDKLLKPTVSLWSNLDSDMQNLYRQEVMAFYPQIFGKSPSKYQKISAWLAAHRGVVDSSLRDRFTAGGKADIVVKGRTYSKVPKIFFHLKNNLEEVIEKVMEIDTDDAKHYWDLKRSITKDQLLHEWVHLVLENSAKTLDSQKQLIIHLLGNVLGSGRSPKILKEEMEKFGLEY